MGFNTVAVIYNDCIHDLETEGGAYGARIAQSIRGLNWSKTHPYGPDFGAGQIISTAHSSYWQPVVVGGNTGYCLGDIENPPPDVALATVARALEEHGFKVTKPGARSRGKSAARIVELEAALYAMVETFKPFTNRPVGAPGSAARLDQEHQIKVHAAARALLNGKEGADPE